METLEPLLAGQSATPDLMVRFVESATLRAEILADLHRGTESERVFRQGIEWADRLAAQSPNLPEITSPASDFAYPSESS